MPRRIKITRQHMRRAGAALNKALDELFRDRLKPTPRMNLPDWADTYRRLSTTSGAIGGPWRTSRVEIARGPMMAVTERGVTTITVMSCTQLMKTSLLENTLGYFAHLDPCPILLAQPKDDSVKAFSKERIGPMAKASPTLTKLLNGDGENDTYDYREYPGGFLAMVSARTPANLAMRAIRITLLDEIDKYETTKEGDPVNLAEERTATFVTNQLHIRTCSPTWEETSRINKSYNEGDQRRPYVACPHCNYQQVLNFFKHVHWNKDEETKTHYPETAALYCEKCNKPWRETQRMRIMQTRDAIKWRQTRPFECCGETQVPMIERKWKWDAKNQVGLACCKTCGETRVPNDHASFANISKLYSPFETVVGLAKKWVEAKDDPETKQTFVNTQLGETFERSKSKIVEQGKLAQRREVYAAPVPMDGLVLTIGVDMQTGSAINEGRLEYEVVAWGIGEESWSVDYGSIPGDPAKKEIWEKLDAILLQPYRHESGVDMFIQGGCLDSGGGAPQECYNFARARINRSIWAIKGASDRAANWSPIWPIPKLEPKKHRLTGYKPVIVGVNAAKLSVQNKLMIEEPGPGYCHFPADRHENYFEQFDAESLQTFEKAGVKERKWVLKRGRANEAFDMRCYAYAALCGLVATKNLKLERLKLLMARQLATNAAPPPALPHPSRRRPDDRQLHDDLPELDSLPPYREPHRPQVHSQARPIRQARRSSYLG